MDLGQRLQIAAVNSATFEYRKVLLPRGEAADLVPRHDQTHLLKYWADAASVSSADQTDLAEQVKQLFPVVSPPPPAGAMGVTNIFHESVAASSTLPARFEAPDPERDVIDVASLAGSERERIAAAGIDVLSQGRGAVCILAGGSGTRLGVSFPKGMLVCPDTAVPRSLFQWHCERVLGLQRAYRCAAPIPLLVMLGPQNEAATKAFFAEHKFFGLAESQVYFFTQSCMPCFNPNGKIILGDHGHISMAPGGNAGVYPALHQSGVLAKMVALNVTLIQIVTVDNLLVALADPVLFGSAVVHKSNGPTSHWVEYVDVVAKSTPKLHDAEAVGVFAKRAYPGDRDSSRSSSSGLRWGVLEYSEVGPDVASQKRGGTGPHASERMFDAANIAVHLFSTAFVQLAAERMLSDFTYYHIAKKPVATAIPVEARAALYGADYLRDAQWAPSTASSTPGIKLEAFIFDLFRFAATFKLLNVVRSEEFSAIKNADDSDMVRSNSFRPAAATESCDTAVPAPAAVKKDSPQTAVKDLHALHSKWLVGALTAAAAAASSATASASTSNAIALAKLLETHSVRVELSPLVAPTRCVLDQVMLAAHASPESLVVGDALLRTVAEYCAAGNAGLLVVVMRDDAALEVVDMSVRHH